MERTVEATLAGIHPRSEELVQVSRDVDRGRADAKQLAEARRKDAQALVQLQAKAGYPYVSDGLLGFQDLLRPFAERLEGARVGPLTRWFDNNTFYRQPVVEAPLHRKQPLVEPYLEKVAVPKGHQAKAILPGPYTFAKLVEDKAYGSPDKLLTTFAREALAPEVRWLAQHGVGWVQFSEPALVRERPGPEDWDALQKAYFGVVEGVRITSSVVTSFGDASHLLTELFELPADYIGVDLTETPLDAFGEFAPVRGLQAGLVDARSSIVEGAEEIAEHARELLELADFPALALAPSADLEFVPRAIADQKVQALGDAAKLLQELG